MAKRELSSTKQANGDPFNGTRIVGKLMVAKGDVCHSVEYSDTFGDKTTGYDDLSMLDESLPERY